MRGTPTLRFLPLLLACLLAGCVRETTRPPPADWSSHTAALAQRSAWNLQGKIGLRAAHDSGLAMLSWQQRAASYRLVLSGALGLGKLVLSGDADGVRWTGKDGQPRTHPDPDALIRELWGWDVPVRSLPYWVRGIPDPAHPLEQPVFENGLATRFRQAGWLIEPQAYRSVDGVELPTRVRLEGGDAVLTISISQWSFPPP